MVDKVKSLGDQPSMEEFYMFCAMVRNEGERCLTYVHEADRIQVQADYRRVEVRADHLNPPIRRRGKGSVSGRRARAIERGQVPVEMNEADQATQYAQATSEDNEATTSRARTQEFTQASGMTYQPLHTEIVPYMTPQTPLVSRDPSLLPLENDFDSYRPQYFENGSNFTSLPVSMSDEIPDVVSNLKVNIEMGENNLENASEGGDTNIQDGEPSRKKKRRIIPKLCGTGSHYLYQHAKKNEVSEQPFHKQKKRQ